MLPAPGQPAEARHAATGDGTAPGPAFHPDGHPQQTTAQIMACSRWAVRCRQQRAVQHLAAQLATRPTDTRTPAATAF